MRCAPPLPLLAEYGSYVRTFDEVHEIAPGVTAHRTGGHTPGHSVVRLKSNGEALTFAGDAIFAVGFEQPNWHNGFEHDPEGAAQVRITLLNELAGTGEMLVATHLPFPRWAASRPMATSSAGCRCSGTSEPAFHIPFPLQEITR